MRALSLVYISSSSFFLSFFPLFAKTLSAFHLSRQFSLTPDNRGHRRAFWTHKSVGAKNSDESMSSDRWKKQLRCSRPRVEEKKIGEERKISQFKASRFLLLCTTASDGFRLMWRLSILGCANTDKMGSHPSERGLARVRKQLHSLLTDQKRTWTFDSCDECEREHLQQDVWQQRRARHLGPVPRPDWSHKQLHQISIHCSIELFNWVSFQT